MSICIHSALSWLPKEPEDLKKNIKGLEANNENLGLKLRHLATHKLDLSQLNRLAKKSISLKEAGADLSPLIPFKLGIVGNVTTEFFPPAFIASALRYGIDLEIYETPFNTMPAECLNPESNLNKSKCDAVLFMCDYRQFPLDMIAGDSKSLHANVDNIFSQLMGFRDGLNINHPTLCFFTTFVPPVETLFGSIDKSLPGTTKNFTECINARLYEHCSSTEDILIEQQLLAETIGLSQWHDPTMWHLSKMPFSMSLMPVYADFITRHIGALRGKSRRALVLDLDNTLWGGVIGDDGLEGIQIGNGSAVGEAYLNIQKMALSLRDRGIILAVCSKNNDDVARQPFEKHPDMLIKEEHISVFQANWQDKASNIQAIAEHLSLGLDSFVFLDDNPAERARVRQMLPQVAVPELPEAPEYFVRTLMAAGYFDTLSFLEEDKKRADYYDSNAKRLSLKKTLGSFDDYLRSLRMVLSFSPFDGLNRGRIAQLINKSNQFNLTTRRYSENDVKAMEEDDNIFTLQARLEDSFGDNGMIGVVICRTKENDVWEIDSWLMSCRVLERRVEEAALSELIYHARLNRIKTLRGVYLPTDRNVLVKDHYKNLGFNETNKKGIWTLDIDKYISSDLPISIKRTGFDNLQENKLSAKG